MFESPIDALSLATLFKARGVATWDRGHYLSLGGTSPLALLQFLYDRPEIDRIYLCLDNDKAGLDGMGRIEAALRDDKELQGRALTVERKPPPVEHGKDYNELLRATLAERPAPARGPKERSI